MSSGGKIVQIEVINTSDLEGTQWKGEQILVIYEKEHSELNVENQKLVAKPETWDMVAETYNIAIEDGEAQLADNIEKILKSKGLDKGGSLVEMGCGSGHLSACLAKKGYKVTLVDFSSVALEKAKQTFEKYGLTGEFILGDLFKLSESVPECDFAWNSGVMEHFGDEEIIILMENIRKYAKKGVLYLVPNSNSIAYLLMRARLMADDKWIYGKEYLRRDYKEILSELGYRVVEKSYISTATVSAYQMWKAEREQGNISELYKELAEEKMLPVEEGYLIGYFASEHEKDMEVKKEYIGTALQDTRLFDLVACKIGYKELQLHVEELQLHVEELQEELSIAKDTIQQKNTYIMQTQNMCSEFSRKKLMRINHFIQRVKGQLIYGNKKDRREFKEWLFKRVIRKTGYSAGTEEIYNPWAAIRNKLNEAYACSGEIRFQDDFRCEMDLPIETKKKLQDDYTRCDVIILSVIDYNFRFQRPQHLASRFVADGHRVFYVNANFIRSDSITAEQKNLFIVDFASADYSAIYNMNGEVASDWMEEHLSNLVNSQAIRDAVVIVDYPNWVYGAEYLRKMYGFRIVTDYMDDYTGFIGTSEVFLKDNCIRLLGESDLVVASSQFLYEIAVQYTDADKIELIRNGTETEHFYQAFGKSNEDKEKKTIGYYGAVAHWFAWEKVCYVAERFSDCDIVIVGEVTEYREKLEKYKNIKLLGEKSYKELPQYLAGFDVCLIPFDASTDLIKATNPVKFYEYLSAGKKIVATEIPELMPYKDEYVYMSNDNKEFTEYVGLCLKGEDILKSEQECVDFARKNDWQERYSCFKKAYISRVPMVSVVVLTYNNIAYNKQCINSILKKTAYANYELIIVDNQSTDGTIEYLKELEQKNIHNLKVILNDVNYGFAGGNNIGIREAKGDYILLLNNDTVVTRGWMTAMVKHLEADSKLGMCNPVTNSIGNESKIQVYYHNVEEMNEFAYKITTEKMNEEYRETESMPLFATLIRRKMIDEIGMLDEAYKVGMFEDDDYLATVKSAGYDIAIVEDAFIHHVNNGTFKKLKDEEYKRIFETNRKYFETKWNKKWKEPKYRPGVDWWTNEGMGEELNDVKMKK